jgi:predicted NAD/FAD-binding protein
LTSREKARYSISLQTLDKGVAVISPFPASPLPSKERPSVAIVGSGVSGLTAAYLLSRTHAVTLFESDDRLGGHAHTHEVNSGDGVDYKVESGFIVHNDRTYPLLRKLFADLGIKVHPTEMSMSIQCQGCGLEYAGGRGLRGIFAQPRRLFDLRFLRLLLQVKRFHIRANVFLQSQDDSTTYGEFLAKENFSKHFITHYAIPVVACVWSSGGLDTLNYPARYLFQFLNQHGLLQITGSPQWFTVEGGSSTYVNRLALALSDVRTSHGVTSISRSANGIEIHDITGNKTQFDRVVIATHADQALSLLVDASEQEREVLGAFMYSSNQTVLHTDSIFLPVAPAARASWNYRIPLCTSTELPAVVTYWMNHLQGIDAPDEFLVTLNATEHIDPEQIIAVMNYEHPIYTVDAVNAQTQLNSLATEQTIYAGAYHGWGFHEDGCRSGVLAAEHFGVTW